MNELVLDLQDVRKLLELGEEVEQGVLQTIIADVSRCAPGFSRADLELLSDEIARVIKIVGEQQADIVELLSDIHHGRAGINGYNHLKSMHKAQRLSKRA